MDQLTNEDKIKYLMQDVKTLQEQVEVLYEGYQQLGKIMQIMIEGGSHDGRNDARIVLGK